MVHQSEDFFSVCVKIVEASDLPHPDISSFACVQVGRSKKYSRTRKHTDKPRFDEYFVFDLHTSFTELLSTVISISLLEPIKSLRLRKLIGVMSMEVSTVWALEGRRMKRWLVVSLPSDVTAVHTGFVNCDISIEASEQYHRVPLLSPVDMPNVIGGTTGRYMVRVYRCIGLETEEQADGKQVPEVSIRVTFAKRSETTTKRTLRETSVEWNEQITFIELVPPLYQKITAQLLINRRVLASKEFYLYRISHIAKKDGFYPTYGPTYVHLYGKDLLYKASVLVAIETEHLTLYKYKEKLHAVLRQATQPADEYQFYKMENFLLFGVVFDVVFIEAQHIRKPLHVRINFGKQLKESTETNNTSTRTYRVLRGSSGYQYLPLAEQKPCLFVKSEWPDTRYRMSNCNVVAKLADNLRERVDYAKNLHRRGITKEAEVTLKSALQRIKSECKAALDQFTMGVTTLDIEDVKLMVQHITKLSSTAVHENNLESLIKKSNVFLSTLDLMSEGMQESLPYILLSVLEDKTTVGICRLHPREIIHARSEKKKGANAGKIISISLSNEDSSYIGQLNIWLWLGLWSDVSDCLRLLPPGHEDITKSVTLPVSLSYETDHLYAVVCHVLRGIVRDESNEGLCDPYVSILLSRHRATTKTVRKTLTPLWKETLILSDIKLYPTPQYLEQNPPSLTIELMDGSGKLPRLLGTAMIKPKLRLQPFHDRLEYEFQWYTIGRSQVLAFFEIIQLTGISDENLGISRLSDIVPEFLYPPMVSHRLEIVFWGIRANDTTGLKSIVQPQAVIQCGQVEIKSEFMVRTNKVFNFKRELNRAKLELPQTKLFTPPLTVRLMTSAKYFGTHIENNLYQFMYNPPSEKQWRICTTRSKITKDPSRPRHVSEYESMPDLIPLLEQPSTHRRSLDKHGEYNPAGRFMSILSKVKTVINSLKMLVLRQSDKSDSLDFSFDDEDEDLDWWARYYLKDVKTYRTKLEDVKGFNKFNDVLTTFPIKQENQDGKEIIANVKVMICMYKWPVKAAVVSKRGQDLEKGVLKYTELSERVKLLVRVYCIKATDLHPADVNGSADPFIEIATQSTSVSDEANCLSQQLNPVFGRCLEIRADFPVDTLLSVRVMDYDRISAHDLIGETVIDLENRFYSKHRATCGLASTYSVGGYDSWRDVETPTTILEKLCNHHNLPLPQYYEKSVVVASKEFSLDRKMKNKKEREEQLALDALRRWNEVPIVGVSLVPEHIETRPLYNYAKRPGIEQGTLEMWVDIFDMSLGEVPPAIDISPRKPQPYELRLIVWNTVKVPLVDDSFFVGKKHSDIFVKGWLWDSSGAQSTDVHYTSINGTGNFNWRFVFPFHYLRPEKRMVIFKRNIFEIQQSEHKVPAIVSLQVWDKDKLSANDFIGSLELELCRMPRGARSANTCKVQISEDETKRVDLFKVKHMKGWWPFTKVKDGTRSSAGFLEAEFHLLTADEAAATPAGQGRSEPSALPPPVRPKFRVKFWLAPFRVLYYYLCSVHKGKVLICLLLVAVSLFLIVALYSIPMFIIKKIIGA